MTIVHRLRLVRRMRVLARVPVLVVAFILLPIAPLIGQSQDAPAPLLALDPAAAAAGALVTATGTGFPADATGQLLWTDGSWLGSFAADPVGTFAVAITVPAVEPGVYTVAAVVDGGDPNASVAATLTVEAPSDQPLPPDDPAVAEPEAAPTEPPLEPTETPFYAIAGSGQSDNSPDAAVTYDGDPATFWITDAITPAEAFLTLGLGEVRPIAFIRWLLATSGTLSEVEIQLSEDGATWASLVTLDGVSMPTGVWIEQPVDVWARYIRFVVPNPDGMSQLGGFAEIEVWPAADARPLAAIDVPEAPTPTEDPAPTGTVAVLPEVTGQGVISGTDGDGVNCRIGPDPESAAITVLAETTMVELTGSPSGDWQPVLCDGQVGWVSAQFVRIGEPEVPITETVAVLPEVTGQGVITGTDGDGVNCRVGPDPESAAITVLAETTMVELTGPAVGEWQPVRCAGQPGYVSSQFVRIGEPETPTGTVATDAIAADAASPAVPTAPDATPTEVSTSTVPSVPTSGPLTFLAFADAPVQRDRPDTNFGNDPVLVSDRGPMRETYLMFTVSGISGAVQQATLRLWVTNGTPNGPKVFGSSDTSWSESDITWNTRPAAGDPIGDTGRIRSKAWVEYDVTSFVTGDGSYSFALIPDSNDGLYVNSREASSNLPDLVLVVSGSSTTPLLTPTPTTQAPTITPTQSAATPTTAVQVPTPTSPTDDIATPTATTQSPTPTSPSDETAILLAAGDIATCGGSGDEQTATILDGQAGTIATLGDNAYPDGTSSQFADCYGPSWGRHKARTRPAPGNHDYHTSGATGYYGYFGAAAGSPSTGYYSYDLGAWHIIALNSNIDMGAGSAQVQWLRDDLAANPASCTLAYWHHPRFSSSSVHGDNPETGPLFQALYDNGADIVLAGHDHTYERFGLQNPGAQADPGFGIREFVVGTGGASLYGLASPQPNSEVRNNATFGVLKLTLSANGYAWQFLPVAGKSFTDAGSGTCHGAPGSAGQDGPLARERRAAQGWPPLSQIALFTSRPAIGLGERRRIRSLAQVARNHRALGQTARRRSEVRRPKGVNRADAQ